MNSAKLDWRDVRAIRDSARIGDEAGRRYGVCETLIRRIRRRRDLDHGAAARGDTAPASSRPSCSRARGYRSCACWTGPHRPRRPRIRMPRVKTDASERIVPMVPALHEILLARTRPSVGAGERRRPSRRATAPASTRTTSGRGCSLGARPGERAARRAWPAADRPPDPTHVATDVRVDPRRGRCAAEAGDVSARPHRPDAHDAGLPAGPGHGRRGAGAARRVLGCTVQEAFAIYSGREVLDPIGLGREILQRQTRPAEDCAQRHGKAL